MTSPFAPPKGFYRLGDAWRRLAASVGLRAKAEQYELFDPVAQPSNAELLANDRLLELIGLISRHYIFTNDYYPELPLDTERRLHFALRHSAFHFAKTAGQLAAVCEALDHGEEVDIDALRDVAPKALINTLKLAELIDLTEQELIDAASQRYRGMP